MFTFPSVRFFTCSAKYATALPGGVISETFVLILYSGLNCPAAKEAETANNNSMTTIDARLIFLNILITSCFNYIAFACLWYINI